MEKCVITQLKGGVNVDNLPYFKGIRIYSQNDSVASSNNACIIRGLEKPTVETISGTFNIHDRSTQEIGILPQTAGAKAVVKNKYQFTYIRNVDQSKIYFDFNDLMYCQELETILFQDYLVTHFGDISNIDSMSKLQEFTLNYIGNIVGDIKKFPDTIRIFKVKSGDNHNALTANIENFGNSIDLYELFCPGFYGIKGRIEKMLEEMLENGKAQSQYPNLSITGNATGMTFNGTYIGTASKYAVFSSNRIDVFSNEQHTNRIAYYDGSWHYDS